MLHHSPLKGRQRISRKQLPPDLDFAFERSFFASSSSDLANLPNLCFLLYHSFYLLYRDLQVQFYKTWFFLKLVIMLPVFAGLLVNQLIVSLFVRRTSPCYCVWIKCYFCYFSLLPNFTSFFMRLCHILSPAVARQATGVDNDSCRVLCFHPHHTIHNCSILFVY